MERMENQQRESDGSGWHAIRPEVADSVMASRTTQRKAPASRGWYHAKWIAINIALIAALAYLYVYQLVPRITGTYYQPSAGNGSPDPVAEQETTSVIPRSTDLNSVQRLRREPPPEIVAAVTANAIRCIDGRAFIVHKGAPAHIEQTNARCVSVDP